MAALLNFFGTKSQSWNVVERLIFPAPHPTYNISSFPGELIQIPRDDGRKVPCLFLTCKHARFLIIYFHANAEDLGLCYSFCVAMRNLFQVHVLAVEYPGYGIAVGTPDEAGIRNNAFTAIRFVIDELNWPLDGIKVFGRSLGTGPALALAAEYTVAGVILVSPYTSIKSLFQSQVGKLADFVQERFENEKFAPQVVSPTLIIHGMQDGLIPPEHGKRIYTALLSRKMLVSPATMAHNTSLLKDVSAFVFPMTQFFSLPDYSFEEIEVPRWVFPDFAFKNAVVEPDVAPSAVPRPRCDARAQAVDNLKSPAKLREPFTPFVGVEPEDEADGCVGAGARSGTALKPPEEDEEAPPAPPVISSLKGNFEVICPKQELFVSKFIDRSTGAELYAKRAASIPSEEIVGIIV